MITLKDVEKLAALSRIKITPAEATEFAKDIDSIVGYVKEIQKVSETASKKEMPLHRNIFRADLNPHESGLFTEILLAEAPEREGKYLKVKKIL